MDALLARFGVQAVNYAIRSSIALTTTFAVGQCSRLLKTVDNRHLRAELDSLQASLDSKIKVSLLQPLAGSPALQGGEIG